MDKISTRPWDSADHLKTEDDMADYFEACLQEAGDDPAFIAHALGVIARARGMSQVARDAGLSREGAVWRANLDARELSGQAVYTPASRTQSARLFARLARLDLPPSAVSEV